MRRFLLLCVLVLSTVVLYAVPTTDDFDSYGFTLDLESGSGGVWDNSIGALDSFDVGAGDYVIFAAMSVGEFARYSTSSRSFGADQYSQAVVANPTGTATCVTVRDNGAGTFYSFCVDDTNGYFEEWASGSNSNLQTAVGAGTTCGGFCTIKIGIQGSTIQAFVNGTQVGTNQSDSTLTTGNPGIGSYNEGGVNNWSADDGYTLVGGGTSTCRGRLSLAGVGGC